MRLNLALLLLTLAMLTTPTQAAAPTPSQQSRFLGFRSFARFETGLSTNANETVLLSPVIKAPLNWDQLIVSWNALTPPNTWLKVDARAIYPNHSTVFYTMGIWSTNSTNHPRTSVRHQHDADGRVNVDTLIVTNPGGDVQIQLTLGSASETVHPQMKFLGVSFFDDKIVLPALPPNKPAWGKIVTTTEKSQNSYPEEEGWCSPTSLSMVLNRWGGVHRPDLLQDVPEVAAGVYDPGFPGTGNWAFNAAYAGELPGMRAYVTRFSDISELEDWIMAGIPVVISAPYHLMAPGRNNTGSGHLTVCIGFTQDGDVVINDPATNLKKGQKVRHIYKRADVVNAWRHSGNTVYLVYPENATIPKDPYGHWENP